jgi:hypothetical protein
MWFLARFFSARRGQKRWQPLSHAIGSSDCSANRVGAMVSVEAGPESPGPGRIERTHLPGGTARGREHASPLRRGWLSRPDAGGGLSARGEASAEGGEAAEGRELAVGGLLHRLHAREACQGGAAAGTRRGGQGGPFRGGEEAAVRRDLMV